MCTASINNKFLFLNRTSNHVALTLEDCENIVIDGSMVSFDLTQSDLVALKLDRQLGTSLDNSYLTVLTGNGIRSSADPNDYLDPISVGLAPQVDVYTRDTTRPEVVLNGFKMLDLDMGIFIIEFSEPVNATASFINTTTLLLQHHANSTSEEDVFQVEELACPGCSDSSTVTFTIPPLELNRLKLTPRVCSSAANCWLTVNSPGNVITDMAGNNLVELLNAERSLSRSLVSFIDDTTGPVLTELVLNLTSRELLLTFDEPIDSATFDTTGLTLVAYDGATSVEDTYQLTGGNVLTPDGAEVRLQLSADDMNGLQSRPNLANDVSDTWIVVSPDAALDVTYQQSQAQAVTLQASLVVPDEAPPALSAFDLDFNHNTLRLIFSEPVTISSVQLSQLTFVSSRSVLPLVSYQITGGSIHSTLLLASAEVVFNLTESDIAFIRGSNSIATNVSNTFLTTMSGLAEDTSATPNTAVDSDSAVGVRGFIADTTPPELLSFTLDMDNGEVVLSFSDVVDASGFDVSALTFQGQNNRVPLEWHSLSSSSSSASTDDSFSVTVSLGNDDLNQIKQIRSLATSSSDTYLTVGASLVDDLSGIDLLAITDGKALMTSRYTRDRQRPVLEQWTLDMDQSLIILTFSEVVDITTLDVTELRFQPAQSTTTGYSLTGYDQLIPDDADRVLAIKLSTTDSNSIKLDTGLGTSLNDSYLSLPSSTAVDMNGNDIVTIDAGNALPVGNYIIDDTDPQLESYDLDLNEGLLSLYFDEAVEAASFNVSGLTLVNRVSRYRSSYTLTTSSHSIQDSDEIVVSISKADLDSITSITSLAAGLSSTFLTATKYTVRDKRENQLMEISSTSALPVRVYTGDTTNPVLDSFSLNVSSGQLRLTFTESVLATSFMPTEITLLSSSDGDSSLLLSGGTLASTQAATSITLSLNEEDLNSLKLDTGLGTEIDNTFISLTSSAITDPASNPVTPVSALRATDVVQDSVPPTLESFRLDLDQRLLSLTFNEPILAGSFSIVGVTLQDHQSLPTQSVTLTRFSTSPTTSDGLEFIINLSDTDFNALAANFPLASMETSTFISLLRGTVKDMQENDIEDIPMDNALQVTSHEEDAMRPTFSSFDLDMDLGILTIEFSESVNVSSFNEAQVTIQSSASSPLEFFQLTGGLVSQTESTTIEIDLLTSDLNTLKQMAGLASAQENAYISFTSGTVEDMNRNPVVAVSMQEAEIVNEFTEDGSAPRLQAFGMDFDSGLVTIDFDETVNLSTIDPSAITFHDGNGQNSHTLSSSIALDSGLLTFTRMQLGLGDLNELKRLRICTTHAVCYLSSTDILVTDTARESNQNEAILSLPVQDYITDTTDPRLIGFPELNLNDGTLTLEFSETVDHTSINQSLVVLHDVYVNATHSFEPLQLSSLTGDGPTIILGIGPDDHNRLKLDTELCTRSENCWIRFIQGFLVDVNDNPIEPVEVDTMDVFHRPLLFVPDTTPPQLLSFTIDLDSGDMTFTFDEVVQLSTFDPTIFVFQDDHLSYSFVSPRENGLSYRSADGLQVNWTMTKGDLNLLKSYELVFASFDSSYLTYSNNTIADVSLVGLQPRVDGVDSLQTSSFVEDTTPPQLEGFLAFSLDNGSMTLQFSEPINISAINVNNLALANTSTLDLHIYDPVDINAWISVYYENGTVFNLTHTFEPGEYLLTCPEGFLFKPTKPPPTVQPTPLALLNDTSGLGSGSASGSGSGSGSGLLNDTSEMDVEVEMVTEEGDFYPLPLRGCTLYQNRTITEPFHFFDGGDWTYVDERKQQIMLNFTRSDLRFFKLAGYIAESDVDTWIAFNGSVFLDMSENEAIPSSLFSATQIDSGGFERDVTRPTFEFVILDLNNDVLSLYFDDVMDVQSVDPTLITISEFQGSNNSYTLVGPYDYPKRRVTIDQEDDFAINIPLSFTDYNAVKANLDLATDVSNTYISFPSAIAADIYKRKHTLLNVPFPNATQALDVIPDTTGALLVGFVIDLNTHLLDLSFNEVVNPATYTASLITIQNAENSSNLTNVPQFQSHTLLNGIPTVNDSMISTVTIQLDVDASALKVMSNLSNTENDTFITMAVGAVLDSSDNPNREIVDGVALQALSVIGDVTPPFLEYYDLNMTANTLTMKFFEAVDEFNPSGITLWSSNFTDEENLKLDVNSVVEYEDFRSVVIVHFTEEDENYLKRPEGTIATSVNTSFLTMDTFTANDFVGLPVEDIQTDRLQVHLFFEDLTCSGLMASEYINDTTLPVLREFTIDMDTGIFVLSFSETVNISTFNPTNLTLVDTAAPEPLIRYQIKNEGSLLTYDDSPIITFQLDEEDLNAIKLDTGLFSAQATSFISLTPDTVIDMSDNFIFAVNFSTAIQASEYTFDDTPPVLENFELDLNASTMILSFSEAVNLLNFNPAVITLQNAYENSTRSYTLEGVRASETLSDLGKVVTFSLTQNDQDNLKAYSDFATEPNNTFLTATSGLITDVSRLNNMNEPIDESAPLMALEVHDDRIPPLLTRFAEFNLGSRSFIHLSFDEPVNISSVVFDRIVLLAGPGSPNNHSLINGAATYVEGSLNKEVDIELSLESILAIKLDTGLATKTDRSDTYITLLSGSIRDQAGNGILTYVTIQTELYVGDTDGPEALGFIINIDEGTLLLSFNDVVDVGTFDITGISIQADIDGSAVDDFVQFNALPTFEATTSMNGLEILINIPQESLDEIKGNQQLAINRETSFLTILAGTIDDLAGNPTIPFVREAALPATGYIRDSTSPVLLGFELDIDGTGALTLTFSEAVVQVDLEPAEVVLVGNNNESFALISKNFPTFPPLSTFTIVLGGQLNSVTTPDLNWIKTLPNLASTEDNVNIAISHLAVNDTSGNNVAEILNMSLPISSGGFTPDTTAPELTSFALDMNMGVLYLYFSETINGSSFNPDAITLRSSAEFGASHHPLTGGDWDPLYRDFIELKLDIDDLNEVKRILDLANSLSTTYISYTENMVTDMSSGITEAERESNNVIPRQLFESVPAIDYQIDRIRPKLVAFSLNLTSELLQLTFDETVNASSLQIDLITILSANVSNDTFESGLGSASGLESGSSSGSGELYVGSPEVLGVTNLTVGSQNSSFSTSSDGTVITIQLGPDDLNSLKVQTGLATSGSNTYISFPEGLIADTSLYEPVNLAVPIPPEMALQVDSFYNDFIAPELERFDLNLTAGYLDLTFSEVVNASSIDITALTLQGSFDTSFNPEADVWPLTVGFNGSTASQEDSTEVRVYLGWIDLNEIKRLTGLATDSSSSYITLTSEAIRDMNSNAVVPRSDGESSLPVAFFTPDMVSPYLHVLNIDMDSGILSLEFSETVLATSLNVTQITVLSSQNETDAQLHTLTSGSVTTSSDNTTINIQLSEYDLNAIKFFYELAQDVNSMFLSVTELAITDMNSNEVLGIPYSEALMVSTFFSDITGPYLRTFDLNLTSETLTLHFDETVNISSIIYTRLTLLSSSFNSVVNYTLEGGVIYGDNTPDVVISLNFTDLNELKLEPLLATSESNTHLYIREGTILDLARAPNRVHERILPVTLYVPDLTNPNLVAFSADLNLGTLTLNFDEPVNASTLNPTGISLLSGVDEVLTLSGGNTTSDNGLQIVVFITDDDLNEIKVFEDLYTDDSNVYIALDPSTISDMNNNPVNAITALNATSFTNDTTSPKLRAFDLDFNSDVLTLEFVETVNTSSINFTGITLQDDSDSNNSYTLTGGALLSYADSTIVQFELLRFDSDQLKIQEIALTKRTTWLTLQSTAIYDQNSQALIPIVNGINAYNVRNYTNDDTQPTLDRFHLNLTDNTLILEFSETVNVRDTLNVSAMLIIAGPNLDTVGRFHRLGIDSRTLSDDIFSPVVTVHLGRLDLNELKKDINLATSNTNTYIALEATAVADMKLNPVIPIGTLIPLPVTSYTEDRIAPELERFDLDMDASTMILYFSETVDPTTLDLSQFLFQSSESVEATSTDVHGLTGGVASTAEPTPYFTVTINVPDLNDLKRLPLLATTMYNTYIRLYMGGIQDMTGNFVSELQREMALEVYNYTNDTTRPELVSFDLNLSSERLILAFSETVNSTSLDVSRIVIQASPSATEPNLRRLTAGYILTPFDTVVEVQLDRDDLNYIKWVPELATSDSNTYISFDETAVEDMFGNLVVATEAEPVTNYTNDDRSPIVVSFELDMNEGTITIFFNETVDTSSLNVNGITIQNSITVSESTTYYSFTSEANTSSSSLNRPTITIDIGDNDLNEIKRLSDLGISTASTFLNFTSLAIADTSGNLLTPVWLQTSVYSPDETDPKVFRFSFDLDTGRLEFIFSETVNVSSLNANQITLQNIESTNDSTLMVYSLTLSGGDILTVEDSTTVTVELLKFDLDKLKAVPIATERRTTFLSITTSFVTDMNGNDVVLIPSHNATMARQFTDDMTRPFLEEYSIDLNVGLITLTFSETVNTSTIDLPQLTLQDARTANSTVQLFSSSHSLEFQPIVTVFISKVDLDLLKQNRLVATQREDTFLTLSNDTLRDMAGNEVYFIPDGSGKRPEIYIQDITAPELETFDFDVDSGLLTLYYSETIDIFSFNHTLVTLQSNSNLSLSEHSFVLRDGYLVPNDSTVAYFTLSIDDLNEVKRLIHLATCTGEDTYLSLIPNQNVTDAYLSKPGVTDLLSATVVYSVESGSAYSASGSVSGSGSGSEAELIRAPIEFSAHIYDMSGNPVQSVWDQNSLFVSECVNDTTSPQLLNFTLTLHNDTLTLTFDETVNASSLDVTQLTLYSDSPDANDTEWYSLESSYTTVGPLSGQVIIIITVSNTDLNEIKRRSRLATNAESTRLSITHHLILDMNGNMNIEILPEDAIPAEVYIPDERDPILMHFELDMTLETLTLSFSETVNASSLRVEGITILNENFTSYRTLEAGYFVIHHPMGWADDPVIVIDLDDGDLNYIKSVRDLATGYNDTYLSIESFTITDMNGNSVEPINATSALPVLKYTPDLVPPELVSFDLNIDSFELFLTFSETVDVSTLNVSALYLQHSNQSLENERFSFTAGNMSTFSTSNDWPEITVEIGINDMNEIKRRTDLATSNDTTFITLSELTIKDMNDNDIVPVPNGNSVQVTNFTSDTTNPQLGGFSINMNVGSLQLTFDETVNFSSINYSRLSIINSQIPNVSIVLDGGETTNKLNSIYVEFFFTVDDLNTLKRIREIATSIFNSYISLEYGAILDMNDNPADAVPHPYALRALTLEPDVSHPHLVDFDLDMNIGTLYLTFNETVEASSLNVSEITLQDSITAAENNTYTITGGVSSMNDSTVITLDFSFLDLNEIKKIRGLASDESGSNTFLTLTNLSIVDMNDNPVVPIPDDMGKRVFNFTQDTTAPELLSFDLDMDEGVLLLNFSETVDTLMFNITQFSLQGIENISSTFLSTDVVTLSQENLLTGDGVIIVQGLLYFDLNRIEAREHLATSPDDTYLSLTSFAIQDMVGNHIVEISEFNAQPVANYTPDINRPMLESFDLDMDTGLLDLTFSETVNISSLDVTEITLYSHEDNATQQFVFSLESSSSNPDWPYFTLVIGLNDLNTIKARDILATRNETSFIDLSELVIRDMAGNMNLPTDNVTSVSSYTSDTTRPEPLEFDLDLTRDILTLRFDETVNAETFDATQITLIMSRLLVNERDPSNGGSVSGSGSASGSGSGSGSGGDSGASGEYATEEQEIVNFTLTGGSLLALINSTQLKLKLSFDDRNEIKRLLDLAVSNDTTYLSIISSLIDDTSSNPVQPINISTALPVTSYIADITPPQLLRFDLDMDGPTLTLYLSETVNASSLNVSAIVLQSTVELIEGETEYHVLTPGPAPLGTKSESTNGPVIVIDIGEEDSNRIKFLTQLAQNRNSTYLSFTQEALKDTSGNDIIEVEDFNGTQVNEYDADETGPVLRSFSLNLTSELLTLVFDETVDFSSLNSMLVTLNTSSPDSQSYRLRRAVPIGLNSHVLVLNLTATQQDLNRVKLLSELAIDLDSTYILLEDGAISDLALEPNYITRSPLSQADEFYPDTISPEITAFNVNLNSGTVTLVFDEVVNSSSLDPTALTFQNSSDGTGSYYQLTGEL